ncbi:antibiotic biosynthesis monooxygenase [Neisseria leonii]|uniref:Antibiotic biosynthesis monooxygenase n=1 Tax=Neisseria leonii TaxID=2995413 RepID=A0A9X4E0G8_9NEIS|nr:MULTISPECIES: antibiotic biosynthesis monooxygenase [unclassified Neisseria]MDD9325242.1 antibiotic biosynthesis monooxygenase [Neisseria sp. 3986]MDD9327202.1 antibiotic biosynthesis monooxygenase [Neisseria sp. 51.81]
MINEFARLNVRPGQTGEFETAFTQAAGIIRKMPGFIRLNLHRHHDEAGIYLLHVQWQNIESHRNGFRESPEYRQWRALLHHFYDPFPVVEYFETILTAD